MWIGKMEKINSCLKDVVLNRIFHFYRHDMQKTSIYFLGCIFFTNFTP